MKIRLKFVVLRDVSEKILRVFAIYFGTSCFEYYVTVNVYNITMLMDRRSCVNAEPTCVLVSIALCNGWAASRDLFRKAARAQFYPTSVWLAGASVWLARPSH